MLREEARVLGIAFYITFGTSVGTAVVTFTFNAVMVSSVNRISPLENVGTVRK
jgi:hypothetical protein